MRVFRIVQICCSLPQGDGWSHTRSLLVGKHTSETDRLAEVFAEIENCDTSIHTEKHEKRAERGVTNAPLVAMATVPAAVDSKVKLEEAKQRRLQSKLKDATEELNALLKESQQTELAHSSANYVPAKAARTFLSSAELIQEKSPQEFLALDNSKEELDQMPALRHSGCSAVISLVGEVVEPSTPVHAAFPESNIKFDCVEFAVRYDVPFLQAQVSMTVLVRAVGTTLATFSSENVRVGDVVHVLGHLVPMTGSKGHSSSCCVYALPAGGNISVVLSKATA